MTPLAELRAHLARFSARCLEANWFAARLHVGVAEDIVADEVEVHVKICAEAYSAEQLEMLADEAMRHGNFTKAHNYLKRAEAMTHRIQELAAA